MGQSRTIIVLGLTVLTPMSGVALAEKSEYGKYFEQYQRPDGEIPGLDFSDPRQQVRIDLGHKLFFDPRVSGSGSISCATCHNPALGWEDGLALGNGDGMAKLGRHSQTILNLAYAEGDVFFWDGRAETLEDQAIGPIESTAEMNMELPKLLNLLQSKKGYRQLFTAGFVDGKVSKENVAKALADYERTVVSAEAPFDRWIKGDTGAINESAKRGFKLFNEKANCAVCHGGWRFTDDGFHNIGVGDDDIGRAKVLDFDVLRFAFKTPTLRNIEHRAPFLHNGSEATLMDVVEFYNRGGNKKSPSLSDEVRPLKLTEQEKQDLVSFLRTLTSNDKLVPVPVLPI